MMVWFVLFRGVKCKLAAFHSNDVKLVLKPASFVNQTESYIVIPSLSPAVKQKNDTTKKKKKTSIILNKGKQSD